MRVCEISGRHTSFGNSIAILRRKAELGRRKITGITRRKYLPNLQWYKVYSHLWHREVKFRLSARIIKMIKKVGIVEVVNKNCYQPTLSTKVKRHFTSRKARAQMPVAE